jgi:hypothetical protein
VISNTYSPTDAHLRCVKRAVDASARGDHLEAGYWLSLAEAARRRTPPSALRLETILSRIIRACSLFLLRAERVV